MSNPTTMAAATVTGRGQAAVLPLLHWWRMADPNLAGTAAVAVLRQTLAVIALLGEPGWLAAATGDATEAVSLALRTSRKASAAPLTIDLAGTALLLCTVDGSAAAAATLHYMRRRFASSVSTIHDGSEA